ncbi:hypothetical protein [Prescottella subtropica]|uniref:hypothetical protein n=1 Tax=Prescottella subtropica TaxID=2545757 RepID=UPI0010F65313|nr:hypothetical protein [Prescottella subtropica]
MAMLTAVANAPAALHPFVIRHGRAIDKWLVRAFTLLLAAAGLTSVSGPTGLLAMAAVGAAAVACWYGARRLPQVTGALLLTLVWGGLVGAVAAAVGPVFAMVHADFVVLYPIGLVAVLAATYVMRSPGVHRGWTAAVGQAVLMLSFPVALLWPGTMAAGYSYLVSIIAALAVVVWRDRKGTRVRVQRSGLRRWLRAGTRGAAFGLISLVLLGSIAIANPAAGSAGPISWVSGKISGAASGAMSDVVCSITRPDLSGQPPGTGPEQFLSNRNLGKVQNASGGVPDFAKDANNFQRAAEASNHSMDSYTLYEISGLRGLKWVNWQYNDEGAENCAMMPWISTLIGNQIMQVNVYLLQATIALKEYAQAKNPIQGVYQNVSPVVGNLYSSFFIPMAGVILIIAGVAAAVRAAGNGGVRRGFSDIGMTAAVALVAGIFYGGVTVASWAKPDGNGFYMIASFGDHVGGMLSSAIADTVFKTLDNQTDGAMMCKTPEPAPGGQSTDLGHRFTSCVLAETLVYQPWAIGQFGKAGENPITPPVPTSRFGSPGNPDVGISQGGDDQGLPCYNNYNGCSDMRSYLLAQTGGPSIDRARSDCLDGVDEYESMVGCDPHYAVANALHTIANAENAEALGQSNLKPNDAAATLVAFSGSGTMPHVAKSLSALFGTVIACIGIAAMSLITLWWHVSLLVVFILGPLRLTWAAFPGKGKMMKNWIDDMVYALIMASVYSILCTLMVFMLGLMFTTNVAAGFKLLWSVAVLVGMWIAMKKVEAAARPEGATQVNAASTLQGATMGALGTAGVMAAMGRRNGGGNGGGRGGDTTSGTGANSAGNQPQSNARQRLAAAGQSGAAAAAAAGRKAGSAAGFVARPLTDPAVQGVSRAAAATGAKIRNSRMVTGAEDLGGRVAAGAGRFGASVAGVGRDSLSAARAVALRTHGAYISQDTRDRWVGASDGLLSNAGARANDSAARVAQRRNEHQAAMTQYRASIGGSRDRDED